MQRATAWLLLPIVALGLMARTAYPATYYLDPSGLDTQPCTEAQPCQTIHSGVSRLRPGDTLYFRAGAYLTSARNRFTEKFVASGTSWHAPVHISAYPDGQGGYEPVVIKPGPGAYVPIHLSGDGPKFIIFEGLILDGEHRVRRLIQLTQTGSLLQANGTQCGTASEDTAPGPLRFLNMTVTRAKQMNINMGFFSHDVEFLNLDVSDALTSHGGYLRGPRLLVRGGRWHHNRDGIGIQYYYNLALHQPQYKPLGCPLFEDGRFENVQLDGNGSNGLWIGQGSLNATAVNVVAFGNGAAGIHVGARGVTVMHSTAWGNRKAGIRVHGPEARIYNNVADRYEERADLEGIDEQHNYFSAVNPGFVDAAAADFHLTPGSALINAGLELDAVLEDFDGVSRPQGDGFDLGAFECAAADLDPSD